MAMTPRDFLEQIVRPNMADLANDYGDIRKAMTAVHSADALAAHIFHEVGGRIVTGAADDTAYRELLAEESGEFRLVRDLEKAAKHVALDRGKPLVTTADQIVSRGLGWGEARWREGRRGSPPQVVVVTDTGEHRVIETVVRKAVEFLEAEMAAFGI
jgi:hypothetical protein